MFTGSEINCMSQVLRPPPPIPPINILYILLGCEYRSVFLHAYNCIDNECHPAIDYSYLLHLLAQPTYNC